MRNIDLFKSIRLWGRLTVLLPMLACSCSDEVSDSSSESKYHETKTCEFTVSDYQSLGIDITDGEAISVFSTDVPDENRKFQFKEMTFSGEIATTGDWYGIYPYKATSSFSYESGNPVAKIDISMTNVADIISDNKDNNANVKSSDIAVTKLSEESFKFNSIYTRLSFIVETEYDYHIDKIEVRGLNGEKLTGFANISFASAQPVIEFTGESNAKALYDCNIDINKGEKKTISLPIVPVNFENGFVVVIYNGTSSTEKEYSSLQLEYGSINVIEDIVLENPFVDEFYVKYKSNKPLVKVVEGYRHEYDEATKTGYIYFDTPTVPDKLFYQKGESVESITLSAAIEKIGSNSFCQIGDRVGLLSFSVEENSRLKEIGYMGVQGNEKCKFDFTNANMLELIGQISFGECYSIMSYNFPNSVKKIEMGAFRSIGWTEVTLNDGVETLVGNQWNGVFQGCKSISKLVLPSTLKTIGLNALKMSHDSKSPEYSVVCKATVPPTVVVENSQFLSTGSFRSKVKAIYVPASSVEAYKSAAGWIDWEDRIQPLN